MRAKQAQKAQSSASLAGLHVQDGDPIAHLADSEISPAEPPPSEKPTILFLTAQRSFRSLDLKGGHVDGPSILQAADQRLDSASPEAVQPTNHIPERGPLTTLILSLSKGDGGPDRATPPPFDKLRAWGEATGGSA